MRIRELMTGMAALLGMLTLAGDLRAGAPTGCSTCGPAPAISRNLHAWHGRMEVWKGCSNCNPRDPFYCGSTGLNGQNGYCNQRLQHVRRIGVLMNHNTFMGDSWIHRYHGGFNYTPAPAPSGPASGFPM